MPLIRNKPDQPAPAPPAARDWHDGIASHSADERWAAVRNASSDPGNVPTLATALAGETEPRVREAIFTALAKIATPDSALVVLSYLRRDDASMRTAALDALRAMPLAARPYISDLLADPDPDVRILACDAARGTSDAAMTARLASLLATETEPNVCSAAVEVLAEIGDATALPALTQCAARFPSDPFLVFAIKVATERLRTEPGSRD